MPNCERSWRDLNSSYWISETNALTTTLRDLDHDAGSKNSHQRDILSRSPSKTLLSWFLAMHLKEEYRLCMFYQCIMMMWDIVAGHHAPGFLHQWQCQRGSSVQQHWTQSSSDSPHMLRLQREWGWNRHSGQSQYATSPWSTQWSLMTVQSRTGMEWMTMCCPPQRLPHHSAHSAAHGRTLSCLPQMMGIHQWPWMSKTLLQKTSHLPVPAMCKCFSWLYPLGMKNQWYACLKRWFDYKPHKNE